ncbi:MAG: DeoR/GlpR transcriptional regulator [Anaerolineae bacterium]|nr:DeoR/GlpR transcriptional regulator [Anaerolineae bacterium]
MSDQASTVERRSAIVHVLAQAGSVEVADLVARFGVSAPTIRRDLAWLEDEGLVRRVRGGALAAEDRGPTPAPEDAAARVGRAAAGLVQDGETVFIGAGGLTLELARALAGREPLTVVTNSLAAAQLLSTHSAHTLILTGGQLERRGGGLGGQLAHVALRDLRADRVFLELGGISAVEGLTDDSLPQAELAQHLLGLSAENVALVSPRRVGRVAAAYIAPAAEVDVVITAREADSAPLWDLTELGVRVVLV